MSSKGVYYNENEPYVVEWLRNLILCGLIADGEVDDRSIVDVRPDDLAGFAQCHFFAGIGGWSLALRLARWADDRPVWTGSCPCQPFSNAGKRGGVADERHLWPEWFRLIHECRPATIFSEQVASKDGLGWLDLVQADLESADYAVGAADLCAAGVGAPHIRQRLWFVADAECDPGIARGLAGQSTEGAGAQAAGTPIELGRCSVLGILGDADCSRLERSGTFQNGSNRFESGRIVSSTSGMVNTFSEREVSIDGICERTQPELDRISAWSNVEWTACTDGKRRPTEPGTFPLAHGVSARVAKLRALGNAIVPQVAAEFIAAAMECRP